MSGERSHWRRSGLFTVMLALPGALAACSSTPESPAAARDATPVPRLEPRDDTGSLAWPQEQVVEAGGRIFFRMDGRGATREEALENGNLRARQEAVATRSSHVAYVGSDSSSSSAGDSFESNTQVTAQGALDEVAPATSLASRRLPDGSWLVRVELAVPAVQVYPGRELDRILADPDERRRALALRDYVAGAERRKDPLSVAQGRRALLAAEPRLPNLSLCVQALVDVGAYTEALAQIAGYPGEDADEAVQQELREIVHRAMPDVRDSVARLVRQARTAMATPSGLRLRVSDLDEPLGVGDRLNVRGSVDPEHAFALVWIDGAALQVWGRVSACRDGQRSWGTAGAVPFDRDCDDLVFATAFEEGDDLVPGEAHVLVLSAPGSVPFEFTEIDLEACARKDTRELSRLDLLTSAIQSFIAAPGGGQGVGIVSWTQEDA